MSGPGFVRAFVLLYVCEKRWLMFISNERLWRMRRSGAATNFSLAKSFESRAPVRAKTCGLSNLSFCFPARMLNMKSLLLHVNHLAKWQDVELAASPPNLEWLSMYGNPITSQPEYQARTCWNPHLCRIFGS